MMWLVLAMLACATNSNETGEEETPAPLLVMHMVEIPNTADPQEIIVPGFGWTVKWTGANVAVGDERLNWEGDATGYYELLDGRLCEKGDRVPDCRVGHEVYDLVVTWFSYK